MSIEINITRKIFGKCVAANSMRAGRGIRSEAPLILNLNARWGCVFKYRPLLRQERYPVYIVQEVKGGQAGLDACGKKEGSCSLHRSSNLEPSIRNESL